MLYPFTFKPILKKVIWGGSDICPFKGITPVENGVGESWELSHVEGNYSVVANGELEGQSLDDLIRTYGKDLLGGKVMERFGTTFPLLIKFIDARDNLSIQVHPNDELAKKRHNSFGKTEMWYVLDAAKDAKLIYGFHHNITKETLRDSIRSGTVEKYLQKVPIQKDDVFYIEAGCVHAIGAGALIAEVQESSNLTYRLYDYDRVDKDGRKRELHIEKALDVANLKSSAEPRQPMRVLQYREGCASELLCRCRYFQTERLLLNTERCRDMVDYRTKSNSFEILLCIDGCGMLFHQDGESLPFFRGDCIFVPADSVPMKIHGRAKFLKVSC